MLNTHTHKDTCFLTANNCFVIHSLHSIPNPTLTEHNHSNKIVCCFLPLCIYSVMVPISKEITYTQHSTFTQDSDINRQVEAYKLTHQALFIQFTVTQVSQIYPGVDESDIIHKTGAHMFSERSENTPTFDITFCQNTSSPQTQLVSVIISHQLMIKCPQINKHSPTTINICCLHICTYA